MNEKVVIEKVTLADLPAIAELADIIWREHYTPIIGFEQVEYMLEKYQSVHAMAQQIAEGVSYFSMLHDRDLVGYLSFYPKDDALFLSKIYVAAEQRGRGLGKLAMQFAIRQARHMALSKIQLTVNKYNSGSIEAYKKMGFEVVDEVVMDIGSGFVMDDFVMVFSLPEGN